VTAEGSSTASTHGARDHARSQAGRVVTTMPVLPASAWTTRPEDVEADDLLWAETVAGGGYTHLRVERGTIVRLRDLEGAACAHVLLHHAVQPWERLNVADTTKVSWQAYLGRGSLLLSDQGRVLASIVDDSSGAHDAFCGTSTLAGNVARYGDGSPQGPSPAGRELFLLAAAKQGMSARDLPPSLSFFQGVRVETDGGLSFVGSAGPDRVVTLRAELPLVMLVANVAHPLDPSPSDRTSSLEVLAWRGRPTAPTDPLWTATPEGERAFLNTAAHAALLGLEPVARERV
jgi:urea carboxylase-associated protein 2